MWNLVAAEARWADFQFKAPCYTVFFPRTVETSRPHQMGNRNVSEPLRQGKRTVDRRSQPETQLKQ